MQPASLPGRGGDRQRLAGPPGHQRQARFLGAFLHESGFCEGHRQDLERHLGDGPEHTERTGQDSGKVVTRDILHDATAEGQGTPPTIDQPRAQQEIT